MMPCAKRHLRFDDYIINKSCLCFMKRCAYIALTFYFNRLKITFPFFIPILLRNNFLFITEFKEVLAEGKCNVYLCFIKTIFSYISSKSGIVFYKTFKPDVGKLCYKYIRALFFRLYSKLKFNLL